MFKVNLGVVKEMTSQEMRNAEITYLGLAFLYENEEFASGSKAMRRSAEDVVLASSYSYAERQLLSSYKELFHIDMAIYSRTKKHLVGFINKSDRTPENALYTWRQIYREIDDLKKEIRKEA